MPPGVSQFDPHINPRDDSPVLAEYWVHNRGGDRETLECPECEESVDIYLKDGKYLCGCCGAESLPLTKNEPLVK